RSIHVFSFIIVMPRPALSSTLFPYTTLFRSLSGIKPDSCFTFDNTPAANSPDAPYVPVNKSNISSELAYASDPGVNQSPLLSMRSEEHTSELQSRFDLVCRLLLEKKQRL